jgi:hypothetical protein
MHTVRVQVVTGQLRFLPNGRYEQSVLMHLVKDGEMFGVRSYEDHGIVKYDFLTGDPLLKSERYAGQVVRAEIETADGLPTGSFIVKQHLAGSPQAVKLLYRQ